MRPPHILALQRGKVPGPHAACIPDDIFSHLDEARWQGMRVTLTLYSECPSSAIVTTFVAKANFGLLHIASPPHYAKEAATYLLLRRDCKVSRAISCLTSGLCSEGRWLLILSSTQMLTYPVSSANIEMPHAWPCLIGFRPSLLVACCKPHLREQLSRA